MHGRYIARKNYNKEYIGENEFHKEVGWSTNKPHGRTKKISYDLSSLNYYNGKKSTFYIYIHISNWKKY